MKSPPDTRLDRSEVSIARLDDPDDSLSYWLERTPRERLLALEILRQTFYGYTAATGRLQRVLEVAELEGS